MYVISHQNLMKCKLNQRKLRDHKIENDLPLYAETFKINIVDVFLSPFLLNTNKKSGMTSALGMYPV